MLPPYPPTACSLTLPSLDQRGYSMLGVLLSKWLGSTAPVLSPSLFRRNLSFSILTALGRLSMLEKRHPHMPRHCLAVASRSQTVPGNAREHAVPEANARSLLSVGVHDELATISELDIRRPSKQSQRYELRFQFKN